jgi:hypothetical protein
MIIGATEIDSSIKMHEYEIRSSGDGQVFKIHLNTDWFVEGEEIFGDIRVGRAKPVFKSFWHKMSYYLSFKRKFKPTQFKYNVISKV